MERNPVFTQSKQNDLYDSFTKPKLMQSVASILKNIVLRKYNYIAERCAYIDQ